MKLLLFLSFFICFSVKSDEQRPYMVFLKEGAVLTKITDKSVVILPKGIYANVLELNAKRRDLFNVFDKNGKAQYQVSALGIEEIADDIKILPGTDASKIYPPKNIFRAENTFAQFDSQFSFHYDALQVSSLNNIYNDASSTVLANRYEVRTLYISELPVEFGLTLNYESAYWKNDLEDVRLSILSLGPLFKFKFYDRNDFNLHALLGAEIAPIYKGTTALFNDQYSAMLFDIGIESQWQSRIGIISLGTHYRHHAVTLTESDRANLAVMPKEFSLYSLGVMIGYKLEWDL